MKNLNVLTNAVVRYIQCHDLPGKYWLYQQTHISHRDRLIRYNVSGAEFNIPWDQWCFWQNFGPENYYLDEMLPFFDQLNTTLNSFDFFDLGADVGVVSALVNKHCSKLKNIYAFEPNPKTHQVLTDNLRNIDNKHKAFNKAVSNINGTCQFVFEQDKGSDHEGFINVDDQGNTKVVSVDQLIVDESLKTSEDIALKVDVEGQEINALIGAKQLITHANKVVLLLELHPDVLIRDNEQAEDIFLAAENIRQFNWYVPLLGNVQVDRARPFFEQFPHQQYDVIAVSV